MRAGVCGPTIDKTIITLPPHAVSSQRGARVHFQHWPFDFADLNWICDAEDDGPPITKQEYGPNCYQDVNALAYFSVARRWDSFTELQSTSIHPPGVADGLTIVNNFSPQILPNTQMFSGWLTSIWGPGAIFMPNGM
jgi:hypothetical protein